MISFRDARVIAFAALMPLTMLAAETPGVACQGRIQPASRVIRVAAYSESGAPVIAKLAVEEGAEVKAGDTLAELAAYAPAKARLAGAEAGVKTARAAAKVAGFSAVAAVNAAELEVASASASLAAARLGNSRRRVTDAQLQEISLAVTAKEAEIARLNESRPAFVERADRSVNAALAAADAQRGDARKAADAETERAKAARTLALKDYDARIAGEADSLAVLKARLAQSKDLHSLPQTLDAELAAAELRLAKARAGLTDARARIAAEAERAEAEIAVAEAQLAQAKAFADIAVVKAPRSGKILRLGARAGEAVGPDGVAEMGDLSKIIVLAEVVAADLPRVKPGQKAEIAVPGIEKPVTGVVAKVGSLIGANALAEENPAAFKDLRVAPVELAVDEPGAVAGLIRAQVTVRIAP